MVESRNTHEEEVTDLSFRAFDKRENLLPGLATASKDGTVREWVADNEIARAVHPPRSEPPLHGRRPVSRVRHEGRRNLRVGVELAQ